MTDLEVQAFNLKDEGRIYLDHNATTPVAREIALHLPKWLNAWGNPSSIHQAGRGPKALLREARQSIAKLIGASPLEVVFTSGGSEANTTVLASFFLDPARALMKKVLIVSAVEHPSLLKTADWLSSVFGVEVRRVPVSRQGELDRNAYTRSLGDAGPGSAFLVSIMAANNETGHLFPVKELCAEAHERGAFFHTDAVQTLGKIPVDLSAWGVDFASFAGHKFYALKGVGILFVRRGVSLKPLIHGGNQERRRRAGTENTLAIASLGFMAGHRSQILAQAERVTQLRDRMERDICAQIPHVQIIGGSALRLGSTSSVLIPGVDGESLLMSLDMEGVSCSTGAACSAGSPEPSPVLLAMGYSRAEAQCSLRIGLGWGTTEDEVNRFLDILVRTVVRLRQFHRSEIASASLPVPVGGPSCP
jgi:cysteine desulfurase